MQSEIYYGNLSRLMDAYKTLKSDHHQSLDSMLLGRAAALIPNAVWDRMLSETLSIFKKETI